MEKCKQKKQINIRLEGELYDFLASYSRRQYCTISGTVRKLIVDLLRREEIARDIDSNNF